MSDVISVVGAYVTQSELEAAIVEYAGQAVDPAVAAAEAARDAAQLAETGATNKAQEASDDADLAQAWAEGTEPGGVGTKSAKEHAEDAGVSAQAAAQQVVNNAQVIADTNAAAAAAAVAAENNFQDTANNSLYQGGYNSGDGTPLTTGATVFPRRVTSRFRAYDLVSRITVGNDFEFFVSFYDKNKAFLGNTLTGTSPLSGLVSTYDMPARTDGTVFFTVTIRAKADASVNTPITPSTPNINLTYEYLKSYVDGVAAIAGAKRLLYFPKSIDVEATGGCIYDFHNPDIVGRALNVNVQSVSSAIGGATMTRLGSAGFAQFRLVDGKVVLYSTGTNARYTGTPFLPTESVDATLVFSHVNYKTPLGTNNTFALAQSSGTLDNSFNFSTNSDGTNRALGIMRMGAGFTGLSRGNNSMAMAHPIGVPSVYAVVFRESGNSHLYKDGVLMEEFQCPGAAFINTVGRLFSNTDTGLDGQDQAIGRIFSIHRALNVDELNFVNEWVGEGIGVKVHKIRKPIPVPDISAPTCIAVRVTNPSVPFRRRDDMEVIFEKYAGTDFSIASMTKMFTCFIALENVVNLNERFAQISSDLASTSGRVTEVGDIMTLEDWIYNSMLPSGSDASRLIARVVGNKLLAAEGGSGNAVDRFMLEMNRVAQQWGMTDTTYTFPNGSNGTSPPRDQALMLVNCLSNSRLCRISTTYEHTLTVYGPNPRTIVINNTNRFLSWQSNADDPNFYLPYRVLLTKTGTTNSAPTGRQLAIAVEAPDSSIVAVVLQGSPITPDVRYRDAQRAILAAMEYFK